MNTSAPPGACERRAGAAGFLELRATAVGAEVRQGGGGEIEVRGDDVFSGCRRPPGKIREELRGDGRFITGGRGTVDPDGCVTIVDRGPDHPGRVRRPPRGRSGRRSTPCGACRNRR